MSHTTPGIKSKTDNSIKNLWRTSDIAYADACYLAGIDEFDIDVAASFDNKKCGRWMDDSIDAEWFQFTGDKAWCNPPFNLKIEFIRKALSERGITMMMLPYEPCTKWFRNELCKDGVIVFVPDGRYNYCDPETGSDVPGVSFASCFALITQIKMPYREVRFMRGVSKEGKNNG